MAAALEDLHRRPAVAFSTEKGWTVATDAAAMTLWSFAPKDDPAYPAAVRRAIVNTDHGAELRMTVLCEASKAACDTMVRTFEALNAQALSNGRSRR